MTDAPSVEDIRLTIEELLAMGLIYDTGKRRNGQIVWAVVPEEKH
jgi:hypothetical protein